MLEYGDVRFQSRRIVSFSVNGCSMDRGCVVCECVSSRVVGFQGYICS